MSIPRRAESKSFAKTPTQLEKYPSFLVNAPFSFSTLVPNNIWMEEMADDERAPDMKESFRGFNRLYQNLASKSLTYILPTHKNSTLQDLVFVANLGIVLTHLGDVVVISNYTSEPRKDETEVGVQFFESLGYEVHVSPHRFEGEADLKHLYGNVYIGGHGLRSELETYKWMEEKFNMKVIPLKMNNQHLYHLDCSVFPVTSTKTMVCTELYQAEELENLRKYTEIIDVPLGPAMDGVCNSVRVGDTLLGGSSINQLTKKDTRYATEMAKIDFLKSVGRENRLKVKFIDIGEFEKGGAQLSCMVMHLNRNSYL